MKQQRALKLPFLKPLTVVITANNDAKLADEDLLAARDATGIVMRPSVTEHYFHRLRLRVAENPGLVDKIAVFYLDDTGQVRPVGLTMEDELHWPPGFLSELWSEESLIEKARQDVAAQDPPL